MPGSQKYSPNSNWNPQSNLLKVFGVSLEMSSDPKKYFGFTFDELYTELVYNVKIAQVIDTTICATPGHSLEWTKCPALNETFTKNHVQG